MTRFSRATYEWMRRHDKQEVSSNELWAGLTESNPELTIATAARKTPRTTCMRDLRKDPRFDVGDRRIRLIE